MRKWFSQLEYASREFATSSKERSSQRSTANRYFLVKRKILLGDDSRVKSLRIKYASRYDLISIFGIVNYPSNTVSD